MPSLVNTFTLVCELPTPDSLFLLTRSDFDDSKKDKKPKDGVKLRTVICLLVRGGINNKKYLLVEKFH